MIGAVGKQMMAVQPSEASGPGKSAQAVGKVAKTAVAVAREAGFDLPRNAQGIAASAVARGIDPASLFAAQVAETGGGEDVVVTEDQAVPVVDPTTDEVSVEVTDMPANDEDSADGGEAPGFTAKSELIISEDPSVALLSALSDEELATG